MIAGVGASSTGWWTVNRCDVSHIWAEAAWSWVPPSVFYYLLWWFEGNRQQSQKMRRVAWPGWDFMQIEKWIFINENNWGYVTLAWPSIAWLIHLPKPLSGTFTPILLTEPPNKSRTNAGREKELTYAHIICTDGTWTKRYGSKAHEFSIPPYNSTSYSHMESNDLAMGLLELTSWSIERDAKF